MANTVWFKRGYGFNKYDPEFYSKWGLNEHEFVLLLGKLKLWFILHPDENYYCKHCILYMQCDFRNQITCTYGKNKIKGIPMGPNGKKQRRGLFCLTWLREGNYVK